MALYKTFAMLLIPILLFACSNEDREASARKLYVHASSVTANLHQESDSHTRRYELFKELKSTLDAIQNNYPETDIAFQLASGELELHHRNPASILSLEEELSLAANVENNPVIPMMNLSTQPNLLGFRVGYSAWNPGLLWTHSDVVYRLGSEDQAFDLFYIAITGCSTNEYPIDEIIEHGRRYAQNFSDMGPHVIENCNPIPEENHQLLVAALSHIAKYHKRDYFVDAITYHLEEALKGPDLTVTDIANEIVDRIVSALVNNGGHSEARALIDEISAAELTEAGSADDDVLRSLQKKARRLMSIDPASAATLALRAFDVGMSLDPDFTNAEALQEIIQVLGKENGSAVSNELLMAYRDWLMRMPEDQMGPTAILTHFSKTAQSVGASALALSAADDAYKLHQETRRSYDAENLYEIYSEAGRDFKAERVARSQLDWLKANSVRDSVVKNSVGAISDLHVALGEFREAINVLDNSEGDVDHALRRAVVGMARAGRTEEAIAHARQIESVTAQLTAFRQILQALMERPGAPDFSEVTEMARLISLMQSKMQEQIDVARRRGES